MVQLRRQDGWSLPFTNISSISKAEFKIFALSYQLWKASTKTNAGYHRSKMTVNGLPTKTWEPFSYHHTKTGLCKVQLECRTASFPIRDQHPQLQNWRRHPHRTVSFSRISLLPFVFLTTWLYQKSWTNFNQCTFNQCTICMCLFSFI